MWCGCCHSDDKAKCSEMSQSDQITDVDVVTDIIAGNASNLQPQVSFAMRVDEGVFTRGSDAYNAFSTTFKKDLAAALGISVSDVTITSIVSAQGASSAGRRRRMQTAATGVVKFIIGAPNAGGVLAELARQLETPGSALRSNSSITSTRIASATPTFELVCPDALIRPTGSLTCISCPVGEVPASGRATCKACAVPTVPNAAGTGCQNCSAGWIGTGGVCQQCPEAKAPNEEKTACVLCPRGRTGQQGLCDICKSGFYAVTAQDPCRPCADLQLPDRLDQLDAPTPKLTDAAVCPGGVPGQEAGICPMRGVWVHYGRDGTPQLLACETAEACTSHGALGNATASGACSTVQASHGLQAAANRCSDRTQGFMCRECKHGYSKVGGRCFECPGFDYVTLALTLLINLGTALFLLHKVCHPPHPHIYSGCP